MIKGPGVCQRVSWHKCGNNTLKLFSRAVQFLVRELLVQQTFSDLCYKKFDNRK
jgi:hypothetical protein